LESGVFIYQLGAVGELCRWARERVMRFAFTIGAFIIVAFSASCCMFRRDYTKGQPNTCEVHGTIMDRKVVPLAFGLPPTPLPPLAEALRISFPHAEDQAEGGCVVPLCRPKDALIYVCPRCVAARKAWDREHMTQ